MKQASKSPKQITQDNQNAIEARRLKEFAIDRTKCLHLWMHDGKCAYCPMTRKMGDDGVVVIK